MKVLVIHGPNLNRLGKRQPEIYGHATLADLNDSLQKQAVALQVELITMQTNHEGVIVDAIHDACNQNVDGIVINPAAYTHSSIAIRDALLATEIPFIEIHLSNVHAREAYRHKSMLADIAQGIICGFGPQGYLMALDGLVQKLIPSH